MKILMMMPVLSAGGEEFFEVVAVAIGVIVMVGSALGQALKKKPAGSRKPDDSPRVSLDELAARRRAELLAEAQRRRARHDAPPTQPDRVTPLDARIAQARQRERDRSSGGAMQASGGAMQEAQLARRRAKAVEQERRRQMELERRRVEQSRASAPPPRRQSPSAAPGVPRSQPPRPSAPRSVAPGVKLAAQPHDAQEHDEVHRLLPTSPEPSPISAKRGEGPVASLWNVRQAVIWKEILDRPLALRDPDDASWC